MGQFAVNLYPARKQHVARLENGCDEDAGLPVRRPEPFQQHSLLPARVALVGLAQGWGELCVACSRGHNRRQPQDSTNRHH